MSGLDYNIDIAYSVPMKMLNATIIVSSSSGLCWLQWFGALADFRVKVGRANLIVIANVITRLDSFLLKDTGKTFLSFFNDNQSLVTFQFPKL